MPSFTLCLNTSTIKPTPLRQKIAIASQTGYRAIEPWNDEIDEYLSTGSLSELRRILADSNLKVVSMIALHSWTDHDGLEHNRVLDECRRRIDQAAGLGSPYIVASPPRGTVETARASARFAQLVELGRAAGVTPSMEFLGFVDGVHTLGTALEIAQGGGGRHATIVADVFHLLRGGGKIDDLLTINGSQLSCFHINDIPAAPPVLTQEDHDRVLPGEGIVDLARVIANLKTIGYQGPLSLELFNRDLWRKDPAWVARTGIERIQNLIAD